VNNENPIDGTSSPDALAHDSAGNGAGANQRAIRRDVLAPFIAVAAWIVPGLGHLLLRRWGRALIFFLSVGGLAIAGYLLRGNVFPPRTGEPFGTLGFLADAGAGMFYFLSHFFESAGPDVSSAAGDYGTRFIAAAGIVNLLSVFDAYEIALGRRTM
jgi:uncharacterized protein DUF6677